MKKMFLTFTLTLLYMEMIYHFASFGVVGINPILGVPVILALAGVETLLVGFFKRKVNLTIMWILLVADYLIYASQMVYLSIFKQPMLVAAVTNAGGAALTNFWRETLDGIFSNTVNLLLLALPFVSIGILLYFEILNLRSHRGKARLLALGFTFGGIILSAAVLFAGYHADFEYYEEYQEFYDPAMIIENYGVLASIQRDALGDMLPEKELDVEAWMDFQTQESQTASNAPEQEPSAETNPDEMASVPESSQETEPEPEIDTSPNVLPIDFDALTASADSKALKKLVNYLQTMAPTNRNEYTGMFEGYNLIYLTAEGFSTYAVDETLTPTLYKMTHSGFVVEDYYVPLWQTSTSDGEYVNMTGLIPDQQFSMKRSANNDQPFSLAAYFARAGVRSYAFHNNSLSYYDRHLSHPNMGYYFKASKLGSLSKEEWGDHIFEMEHPKYWPASDLEMMEATVGDYIDDEQFNVYYMTISGHMNYNFSGNKMANLNKAAVADLPYSEEGRAYIACNLELEKALTYLVEELEKAGKLDKTLFCLSADHYPYGMNVANLEELAGRPLDGTLDLYRNSLILWNSAMETVEVEKTCYAADIIPTLLNLFGFEYDSRLYAGRDMLSDSPSLVIFANKSFITDTISYNKKAKLTESRTEEPVDEAYFDAMKSMVKAIYDFSSGVINQNFYKYVADALPQEYSVVPQFPPKPPKQEQPQESTGSDGTPEGETAQDEASSEITQ